MTSIFAKSARSGSRVFVGILTFAVVAALSLPASATEKKADTGLMPATGSAESAREYDVGTGQETHPPVRLTPEKTEIIKLDEDANSIIIGNPAHLNVLLDNPRVLLLAARQPGATQLTVTNMAGKVIMQRHVIVSGPKEDYIRIRRSCINGRGGCQPTTVYYCPDICHDVRLLAGQPNNTGNPGASIPSSNSGGNDEPEENTDEDELDEDDDSPLLTNDQEGVMQEEESNNPPANSSGR